MYPFYDTKKEEIQKKFQEFRRQDKLSFIRLYRGLTTIVLPWGILFALSKALQAIILNLWKVPKYKS